MKEMDQKAIRHIEKKKKSKNTEVGLIISEIIKWIKLNNENAETGRMDFKNMTQQ